ncbi:M48 family metalloprotease [bacterium]|nr:M48 family metalloprotease [bacterium]
MFRQIESNKRWSLVLVLLCMGMLIAVGWALEVYYDLPDYTGILAALVVALVVAAMSYYGGDSIVLAGSQAQPVSHEDEPRLCNVVEEMAIAAGLPVPEVYVIEDAAPNAFATGRDPRHARVAITRGLMQKLNRDELQGVIAHELSHIRNYDTLFMTLIAVLVGTVVLLSDVVWRTRGRGVRPARNCGVIVIVALLFLLLSPVAARLIQMAASRRREFLADASGALLTRYPPGLASALRKIASDPAELATATRATQHMFIVNPLRGLGGTSLWDTHPPLEERIKRLDEMGFATTEGAAHARPREGRPVEATVAPAAGSMAAQSPGLVAMAAATAGASQAPPGQAESPATPTRPPSRDINACPRCREPMVRGRLAGQTLRGCRACGGLFIAEQELTHLLTEAPEQLAAADHRYPNLVGRGWHSFAGKLCPVCSEALRATPLPGHARIVVDRCPNGHGVWFDDGEAAAATDSKQTPQARS